MIKLEESLLLDGSLEKTLILETVSSFLDLDNEDVLNNKAILNIVEELYNMDYIWREYDNLVYDYLKEKGLIKL